jgi:hypothetical protein
MTADLYGTPFHDEKRCVLIVDSFVDGLPRESGILHVFTPALRQNEYAKIADLPRYPITGRFCGQQQKLASHIAALSQKI